MRSFHGGVHPPLNKQTKDRHIRGMPLQKKVVIPLIQHIGQPCKPLVKVGDYVKVGQKIGESGSFCSAAVHASLSGAVAEIGMKQHPLGTLVESIVVESDGRIEWDDSVKGRDDVDKLSREELIAIVKDAGIVGLGGAAFPTHAKLTVDERKIDTVIINGAECEPYLTADHRLMLEEARKILSGARLIQKMAMASKVIVGIESSKHDAFLSMQNESIGSGIQIMLVETKYPQGAEKMLISSVLKRKVPTSCLPLDVGCIVNNVATAKAVHDAVYEGKPLIERVITVAGALREPGNIIVRIGTLFSDVLDFAGIRSDAKRVMMGGPMMGFSQENLNVPVIKGTSGILALDTEAKDEERRCIRCGRCIENCPMLLMPNVIAHLSKAGKVDMAEENFAMDCFECGCCAYGCPSKIPLVKRIKQVKLEIQKKRCKPK